MKARTRKRWIARVALGLAVASIAAPIAQAQAEPYGELYQHASMMPYGELYQHTPVSPYGELYQHDFRPDGTPIAPVVVEAADPVVAPSAPAPEPYGELYQHEFPESSTPVVTTGGIDWSDAGIGAGVALGAILLAAAAALGIRRRGLAHS